MAVLKDRTRDGEREQGHTKQGENQRREMEPRV